GGAFCECIEKGARHFVSVRAPFLLVCIVTQADIEFGTMAVSVADDDTDRITFAIRATQRRSPEIPQREADAGQIVAAFHDQGRVEIDPLSVSFGPAAALRCFDLPRARPGMRLPQVYRAGR